MMPAVFGTMRMFEKDLLIGGYRIPRDTVIIKVGSFTSLDRRNFSEPEKFLPERWLRGHKARHSADSFANIPFGHGARSCVGQRFARLELFTLMTKLVQHYKLEYAGDGDVGIKTQLVSVPNKQIKIKFIKR